MAEAAVPEYEYVDDDPNRIHMLVDPKTADRTYLSSRLSSSMPAGIGKKRSFSWVSPSRHGLRMWTRRETPVMPTLQQLPDMCIVFQVYNFLRFQMNLIVRFSGEAVEIPEVSLSYLLKVFENLPENRRTFKDLLVELHDNGFVSTQDFNEEIQLPKPNARRYFIHYHKGFNPEELTASEFQDQLKSSIVYHGGVLAEMAVPPTGLTPDEADGPPIVAVEDDATGLPLGHALLVLGWLVRKNKMKQWKVFTLESAKLQLCLTMLSNSTQ